MNFELMSPKGRCLKTLRYGGGRLMMWAYFEENWSPHLGHLYCFQQKRRPWQIFTPQLCLWDPPHRSSFGIIERTQAHKRGLLWRSPGFSPRWEASHAGKLSSCQQTHNYYTNTNCCHILCSLGTLSRALCCPPCTPPHPGLIQVNTTSSKNQNKVFNVLSLVLKAAVVWLS